MFRLEAAQRCQDRVEDERIWRGRLTIPLELADNRHRSG